MQIGAANLAQQKQYSPAHYLSRSLPLLLRPRSHTVPGTAFLSVVNTPTRFPSRCYHPQLRNARFSIPGLCAGAAPFGLSDLLLQASSRPRPYNERRAVAPGFPLVHRPSEGLPHAAGRSAGKERTPTTARRIQSSPIRPSRPSTHPRPRPCSAPASCVTRLPSAGSRIGSTITGWTTCIIAMLCE